MPKVKSEPLQLQPGVHFIKAIGHKLVVVTCKPSDSPDHDLEVVDAQAIKIPRRRVLGYVVREGLERGKGRYSLYGVWVAGRGNAGTMTNWLEACANRHNHRRVGDPCRIITVVAKPKTKEPAK